MLLRKVSLASVARPLIDGTWSISLMILSFALIAQHIVEIVFNGGIRLTKVDLEFRIRIRV